MNNVVKILKEINAVETNSHFIYTSGRHGSVYLRKDLLYTHIDKTSKICKLFAEKFKNKNIDIVIGPALGGIILAQWTAYHLSKLKKKKILALFTEKDDNNNQTLKRGYNLLVKGKNVLVVEDLTTTGSSVKKVVDSIKKAGGKVVSVCVMLNRDPKRVKSKIIGAPFSWLGIFKADSFANDDCPLCQKKIPINTTVGHGAKFLSKQP